MKGCANRAKALVALVYRWEDSDGAGGGGGGGGGGGFEWANVVGRAAAPD